MPKNISTADDILGTLAFPINVLEMGADFALGYFKALTINASDRSFLVFEDGLGYKFGIHNQKKGGYVSCDYKGRELKFFYSSKKELFDTIRMIKNEFLKDESGWLNVKGKNVLDIGAYVGDTAIYFALHGAKHVFAAEPYPYFYELGKRNVNANKLGSKVTMLNVAIGSKRGDVRIDSERSSFASTTFKSGSKDKSIKMLDLQDAIKKYDLKDGVLKIDCEGFEYKILLNASKETLRSFSEMEIEYHYGYYNIERKLKECGFSVQRHKPTKRLNFGTRSVMVNGFMHAKRVGK